MKITLFLALLLGSWAAAQTPDEPAREEPETPAAEKESADREPVVVIVNGKPYTAAEIRRLRASLPTQYKQQTQHMSTKTFLETLGYLDRLATLAEEEGLAEQEPYKTQLEFNRANFLAQVYLTQLNTALDITEQDKRDYYEQHPGQFAEVKAAAIVIDYTPIPELARKSGKEVVPEQEAFEKAHETMQRLRDGEEFAKLVEEVSDDAASAEKGGDLGWFDASANIAAPLKQAILALDEGQISQPVKDGGRYYIFQAAERRLKPYNDVAGAVLSEVQKAKLGKRLDDLRESVEVEFKDPEFAGDAPPAR